MWLPKAYRRRQDSTLRDPPASVLDHPIVVLSVTVTGPKDAIIVFAILRSFASKRSSTGNNIVDISEQGYTGQYVEILPLLPATKKEVFTAPPLTLEYRRKKRQLQVTSFVDLDKVFSAQLVDLCVYNAKLSRDLSFFRLSEESFKYVWGHIKGKACGVGIGAAPTPKWVPTKTLRNVFAKCAMLATDDALKASIRVERLRTTVTTTTRECGRIGRLMVPLQCLPPTSVTTMTRVCGRIDCLILLLQRLAPTIVLVFAAPPSQVGAFPPSQRGGLPLPPRLGTYHRRGLFHTLLAANTSEETATTVDGIYTATSTHVLTYMLYTIAVAMIRQRLVRRGQGTRRRRSFPLVFAGVAGGAALLAAIAYVEFVAIQSAETVGPPAQAVTASMAPGVGGPEDEDEEGWTTVTNSKRRSGR